MPTLERQNVSNEYSVSLFVVVVCIGLLVPGKQVDYGSAIDYY